METSIYAENSPDLVSDCIEAEMDYGIPGPCEIRVEFDDEKRTRKLIFSDITEKRYLEIKRDD